jgi:hypothetical protein
MCDIKDCCANLIVHTGLPSRNATLIAIPLIYSPMMAQFCNRLTATSFLIKAFIAPWSQLKMMPWRFPCRVQLGHQTCYQSINQSIQGLLAWLIGTWLINCITVYVKTQFPSEPCRMNIFPNRPIESQVCCRPNHWNQAYPGPRDLY